LNLSMSAGSGNIQRGEKYLDTDEPP
jgi:hypothetical protein